MLSHALESYTAIPYTSRPRPARPLERPAYQGCNPISDVWALRALELVAEFLLRAVADPADDEARANMLLASAIAGIGFGNAGCPLAARHVVPRRRHGARIIAPPVTASTIPWCRTACRSFCTRRPSSASRPPPIPSAICEPPRPWEPKSPAFLANAAGDVLADRVLHFMRGVEMPNGLSAVGYTEADIPALVEGTLPQHRVTKLSPRPAGPEELAELFRASMRLW